MIQRSSFADYYSFIEYLVLVTLQDSDHNLRLITPIRDSQLSVRLKVLRHEVHLK